MKPLRADRARLSGPSGTDTIEPADGGRAPFQRAPKGMIEVIA